MVGIIGLATLIAGGTILYGIYIMRRKRSQYAKKVLCSSIGLMGLTTLGMLVFIISGGVASAAPIAATGEVIVPGITLGEGFKYLAASLSTGLATIGTGAAVGAVGSSAIGAVSEDPAILGKTLIFVGMAEGIAIYGMIISILILFV